MFLEGDRLVLAVDDEQDRNRLQEVFDSTGEVTWAAWSQFEGGEPMERRAQPRTDAWLWFVVANILYPMGYQADVDGLTE